MQVNRSQGSCSNNCFEPKPKNLFVLSLLSLMVAAGAGAAGYYLGGRNFTTALIAGGATLGVELLGGGVMVIRRCKKPQDSPPGQNPGVLGADLPRPRLSTNSLASSATQPPAAPNWQTPLLSGQPPDTVLPQPAPAPVTAVESTAPEPIEDAEGNLTTQGAKNICNHILENFHDYFQDAKDKDPITGAICISNKHRSEANRPKDEIHRFNALIARPLIFTVDGIVAVGLAQGKEEQGINMLNAELKRMSYADRTFILERIRWWPATQEIGKSRILNIDLRKEVTDNFMWLENNSIEASNEA